MLGPTLSPDFALTRATTERDLLATLLREALGLIEEEIDNREGVDRFNIACGTCQVGGSYPHSFGCRAYAALELLKK